MLTKKHFKQLADIHAKALNFADNKEFQEAYNVFEFELRDFYKKINVNFDDFKFMEFTQKLAKKYAEPIKTSKGVDLSGFDLIDHLERRAMLDADMNG